jgi:hypothetical protein
MSANVSTEMLDQATDVETADFSEKGLYTIGGVAALTSAAMYFVGILVYIPAYRAGPPPSTVLEWFTLFQNSWLTSLFFLGLADIVIMLAWVPMALALYAALRRTHKPALTVAIPLAFVGIAVYLATNIAFSMFSLSHKYTAATTEAEKSIIQAAGQALIAVSEGTGGHYAGMPLAWLAGLIISVIMLSSKTFSKATAWAGIVGLGLLLASTPFAGYTTIGSTTAVVSALIAVTYIGGGLLSLAWYILVGRRLLQLGRLESNRVPRPS